MIRPDEYWAGQTDGDGCILVTRPQGYFVPKISFRTTHEETVRAFQSDMGVGTVQFIHPPSSAKHPNWKPRWGFTVTSAQARYVIRRLRPYLIEKAVAATLALKDEPFIVLPRTDVYFAGLVDAEGNISLSACNGKNRPNLVVKMTNEETVTAMHSAMGSGSLFTNHSPSMRRTGRKRQWTYKASTQIAIEIIARLRPFLLTKANEADTVLAYYQTNKAGDDKKLNRTLRNELRRRYAAGETQASLAIEYGIHHVTASDICCYRNGVND